MQFFFTFMILIASYIYVIGAYVIQCTKVIGSGAFLCEIFFLLQ